MSDTITLGMAPVETTVIVVPGGTLTLVSPWHRRLSERRLVALIEREPWNRPGRSLQDPHQRFPWRRPKRVDVCRTAAGSVVVKQTRFDEDWVRTYLTDNITPSTAVPHDALSQIVITDTARLRYQRIHGTRLPIEDIYSFYTPNQAGAPQYLVCGWAQALTSRQLSDDEWLDLNHAGQQMAKRLASIGVSSRDYLDFFIAANRDGDGRPGPLFCDTEMWRCETQLIVPGDRKTPEAELAMQSDVRCMSAIARHHGRAWRRRNQSQRADQTEAQTMHEVEAAIRVARETSSETELRSTIERHLLMAIGVRTEAGLSTGVRNPQLYHVPVEDKSGQAHEMLAVFTNRTNMRPFLERNPRCKEMSIYSMSGPDLYEHAERGTLVVVNPWTETEYRLRP